MTILTCPSCAIDTPSEYNFCLNCDKQIKCLNPACNKLLVAGKAFCFHCGQPLIVSKTLESLPNKYVREVKQQGKNYEERTEFSASDYAVSELAPFLVGQMTGRPPQRPSYPTKTEGSFSASQRAAIPNNGEGEEVRQLPPPPTETHVYDGTSIEAYRYFERDGDFLIATEKDYKGKNWAEQQRYFILLYTSAYLHFFQKPVPSKDHYKTAAEKASIYDASNFTRYLTKLTREMITELSDGYKLNPSGEKEVKSIIAHIEDEKAEAGYQYWGRSASTSAKKVRISKDDLAKLKDWAQEDVQIGSLNVREIKKAVDYALVALWLLTVHLKKAETVRWNIAYYYFKEKFTTITASADAFSRAMANDANAKYFSKSDEKYFLKPDGEKKVEGWITGKSFESSTDTDA